MFEPTCDGDAAHVGKGLTVDAEVIRAFDLVLHRRAHEQLARAGAVHRDGTRRVDHVLLGLERRFDHGRDPRVVG